MRPSTLTLCLTAVALSACGGRSLGTSGAAGSPGGTGGTGQGATGGTAIVGIAGASGSTGGAISGTGGAVGGTGGAIGGTGGTGALPACASGSDPAVSFLITDSSRSAIATAVSAAVTVESVENCFATQCPSRFGEVPIAENAWLVTLKATTENRIWYLYLRNIAMPGNFIRVGDAFDMRIEAKVDTTFPSTVDQTLVLMRGGNVVLFAANLHRFGSPAFPDLLPFGIAVSDAGATCDSPRATGCGQRSHAMRVSIATDASVVVPGGEFRTIGGFVITNGGINESVDAGGCDTKSTTTIAGFRGTAAGPGETGDIPPQCANPSSHEVEVAIVGSDQKLIGTAQGTTLRAAVTVTSVGSCATVSCPSNFPEALMYPGPSGAARKIILTGAGGAQWTLYLRNDHMPNDVIAVGDPLDLIVDAKMQTTGFWNLYQTVVLARDGELIAFAANGEAYSAPRPDLSAFRVGFGSTGGASPTIPLPCKLQGQSCTRKGIPMVVTVAGQSEAIARGETKTVGWLSFTNRYNEASFCPPENPSRWLMAGFRTASTPVTGTAGTGGSPVGGTGGGGVGGTGGGGAAGTSGGAGGMLPACTSNGESAAVALTATDGRPVVWLNASKAVTVASVESCTTASCQTYFAWLPAFSADFRSALRIGLLDEIGVPTATLYLRNTAMPPDLIKVGDAFYMTVDVRSDPTAYTTNDQTIVLSRGGQPIVFAAALSRFGAPPVPQLAPHGITVADADAVCQGATAVCTARQHSARVTIGADSAIVAPGQAATIGGFSFTNGAFLEAVGGSSCDQKSQTFIAGFRLP